MVNTAPRKSVVVIRQSPYGSSLARAAVDLSLAMGAFEQHFDLLFMGAGVLQLLPDQDSAGIGLKSIGKVLSSLPLYDVERVYVDADALLRHGINADQLVLPVQALDTLALQELLNSADQLVSC